MGEINSIRSFAGEHRWLSNFWVGPIEILAFGQPRRFQSAEQIFQMAKLEYAALPEDQKRELFENVAALNAPGQTKRFGRRIPDLDVSAWNASRDRAMALILKAKFSQHADLREKLLALEGVYLEEGNHWGDRYWGVDGTGQNKLGLLLMKLRDSWLMRREQDPQWSPRCFVPEYFAEGVEDR